MSFQWFEILSGLAYCAFCALLAAVCLRAKLRAQLGRAQQGDPALSRAADSIAQSTPKNHTQGSRLAVSLASSAALAALLGVPLGSLPALFPFSFGGLVVLGCLGLALGFEEGRARSGAARALALLALALALFTWYARQRGVPGDLFSLDSYVATPLAGLAGWPGRLGMLLLALALLLAVRDAQQELASGLARIPGLEAGEARVAVISALMRQVWILVVLGMVVCLFAPLCPAGWLGMRGVAGLAADALIFWLKLLLADQALWLAAGKLPRLSAWALRAQLQLAGLGGLCMIFA